MKLKLLLPLVLVGFFAVNAHASHAYYGHGVADLRAARDMLDHGPSSSVSDRVIVLIDRSIRKCKECGYIINGTNEEHGALPPDAVLSGDLRNQVLQLLTKAHDNLCAREDSSEVSDARADAVHYIDNAIELLHNNM